MYWILHNYLCCFEECIILSFRHSCDNYTASLYGRLYKQVTPVNLIKFGNTLIFPWQSVWQRLGSRDGGPFACVELWYVFCPALESPLFEGLPSWLGRSLLSLVSDLVSNLFEKEVNTKYPISYAIHLLIQPKLGTRPRYKTKLYNMYLIHSNLSWFVLWIKMCMDMTVEKKKGFYFQMFFCKSAIGKPSSNVYAYKIYCQNFFSTFSYISEWKCHDYKMSLLSKWCHLVLFLLCFYHYTV